MIPLNVVILILVTHYIADFLCQTEELAIGKADKLSFLFMHGAIYGFCLFFILPFICRWTKLDYLSVMSWIAINTVLHIVVDWLTSDINKYFVKYHGYKRGLFNTVGADQLIHYITLFLTLSAYRS